ncbi:hypothetical protein F5Y18DRAFT_425369 [Xylariaceae sp. FL1019]|nr:hypothetical protein F5Y18DRAFT_425369 [Xylariaceae sp. FL1019]
MPASLTLNDGMVTNWAPYFHRDGSLRRGVIVNLECQICAEPLAIGHRADSDHEQYTVLYCGHVIGLQCMRRWVREQSTCPICRKDLEHPGCEHVALVGFEHGADYNIHNPQFTILGHGAELESLCMVCDGRAPAQDTSVLNDESEPDQRSLQGNFTTFSDANTWRTLNSRDVYTPEDLERTEAMIVQAVFNMSFQETGHENAHTVDSHGHHDHNDQRHQRRHGHISSRTSNNTHRQRHDHRHGHRGRTSDRARVLLHDQVYRLPEQVMELPQFISHPYHQSVSHNSQNPRFIHPFARRESQPEFSFTPPFGLDVEREMQPRGATSRTP